jgi:DNA polymerase-3 subunit gamma/tau
MLSLDLRPRFLDDIVGQKNIVKELKTRSKTLNFSQTMLMEGSSGIGKTSTAQIIAQLLNCKAPVTNPDGTKSACQTCPSCLDVISGKFARDIQIIDCSEMDKESVLALKERVCVSTMYDRNKILILDEAQNLGTAKTKGALLLLLEKVYKNVYIIMNTMDVSKFDKSITDRAQTYSFKPIKEDDIAEYLIKKLLPIHDPNNELPNSIIGVLYLVASFSKGSLRRAVQLYEKCITTPITTKEDLIIAVGMMDTTTVYPILSLLTKRSPKFFEEFEVFKKKEGDEEKLFTSFLGISWDALYKAALFELSPEIIKNENMEGFYSILNNTGNVKELLTLYSDMFRDASGEIKFKFFMSTMLLKYYKPMPNGVTIDVSRINNPLPTRPSLPTRSAFPIRGSK